MQPLVDLANLAALAPAFVLVVFRVAGLMLFAPLFGSGRVPRRIKGLLALTMAVGMAGGIDLRSVAVPDTAWALCLGLAGELLFGVALGMIVSLVFIAAQWAGEMVGQQIGFNMAEVLDPQFGSQGSLVGDVYFTFTMTVFLLIGGHLRLVEAVHDSLVHLPPLALVLTPDVFALIVDVLLAGTALALRIAAPMFVTMLVVDVAIGFVGKTMPQMNLMTAGTSLRALVGMVVLIVGMLVIDQVLAGSLLESLRLARDLWRVG